MAASQPPSGWTGEALLAWAVIEDAILTVRLTTGTDTARARRLAADAWAWLASRDTTQPYAFENLCAYLGLDADWLRRGLRRYAARRTLGSTVGSRTGSPTPSVPTTNSRQRAAS